MGVGVGVGGGSSTVGVGGGGGSSTDPPPLVYGPEEAMIGDPVLTKWSYGVGSQLVLGPLRVEQQKR